MNAVNLYTLTRDVDGEMKSLYEKALSQRDDKIKIREEEYELIKSIINNLIFCRTGTKSLEDWFYSFTIPQIGKEFDLLKIGKNYTINIELKSQEVSEEKIIKQLTQNRYYLSHISEEIKKKIIDGISRGEGLWGICGSAGTGKTLLLYDVAKALVENFRICVIRGYTFMDLFKTLLMIKENELEEIS